MKTAQSMLSDNSPAGKNFVRLELAKGVTGGTRIPIQEYAGITGDQSLIEKAKQLYSTAVSGQWTDTNQQELQGLIGNIQDTLGATVRSKSQAYHVSAQNMGVSDDQFMPFMQNYLSGATDRGPQIAPPKAPAHKAQASPSETLRKTDDNKTAVFDSKTKN